MAGGCGGAGRTRLVRRCGRGRERGDDEGAACGKGPASTASEGVVAPAGHLELPHRILRHFNPPQQAVRPLAAAGGRRHRVERPPACTLSADTSSPPRLRRLLGSPFAGQGNESLARGDSRAYR